ncbi:TetR/AcrR family transcriptional regulator [Marinigracilibium pacificum]|uniref:TetR/AcrR family transcriptional regulator n=1 Tax=Marinigracilibium pacificum TaxID=2729599 RepID=A0A848IXY9_9BACT|nr:TetR/AcrR family transcriptional regulator [Marinigracilibium pacificum]NMM48191.1 TetR/AcrR family transcriptional regulator [Marinigracilibium pacificum]
MGRKSISSDRRKEILEAYKLVIRNEGIEGASIGKLAKFLSMPPSLIMHYFSSKDELIKCVASEIISDTYDTLIEQIEVLPKTDQIERIVNFLFGIELQKHFDLFYYRLVNYLALSSEDISNEILLKFNHLVHRISEYIQMSNGSVHLIELNEMSSSLLSSSFGFMEIEMLKNDQSSFFKNSRVIKDYWIKALKN